MRCVEKETPATVHGKEGVWVAGAVRYRTSVAYSGRERPRQLWQMSAVLV